MFKVSHSKVRTWRRCRYLYDLKYVRKLRKKTKGRAQTVGSIIHEALEAKFRGKSPEAIFKDYEKQIDKMFEEERIELKLDGAVDECRAIYANYNAYYKNDGYTYLQVELEFNENTRLEIAPGIFFIGKIDAVVLIPESRTDNDVWIFERKTCKRMPTERTRMSDLQTVLYWAFLPQIRRKIGRKLASDNWPNPRGIVWDYVRSKAPSVPHLNKPDKKTGISKMSMAECDTTWEVYKFHLEQNGLDPKDYADMKDKLAGSEDSFFRRIRLPFSTTLRDQLVSEFIATAIEMAEFHGKVKDRNLTYECERCEFFNLCQAELRGLDTDLMLKKEYEVRKDEKDDNVIEVESE